MTNPPLPTAERAIALIKNEHRALSRMLGAMQAWVARSRNGGGERSFELFDSMLRYIENVPDRIHHPKEDQVLFPALTRRTSTAAALITGSPKSRKCAPAGVPGAWLPSRATRTSAPGVPAQIPKSLSAVTEPATLSGAMTTICPFAFTSGELKPLKVTPDTVPGA